MFIPRYFKPISYEDSLDVIRNHSFGLLLSYINDEIYVTPLPFLLENEGNEMVLYAHLARINEHSKYLEGSRVTVIFQGPHHYISPRWYMDPRSVPTWNYVIVKVNGISETVDHAVLLSIIKKLSDLHDPEWSSLKKENESYYQKMTSEIVGIKIKIDKIEGKFKLSQNHPRDDIESVIAHLSELDHDAVEMAEMMKTMLVGRNKT
ncbi:MAG: FMN-binding negative transcriptional regulator [Thermoplasmataceae archaeon]